MLKRLIADYICWIALTIVLLYFGYVTAASIVGGFGIVYLYRMTQKYRWIVRLQKEANGNPPGNNIF